MRRKLAETVRVLFPGRQGPEPERRDPGADGEVSEEQEVEEITEEVLARARTRLEGVRHRARIGCLRRWSNCFPAGTLGWF